MDHLNFAMVVTETWNETEPMYHARTAPHLFHQKLKLLKPALQLLSKTRFGISLCAPRKLFRTCAASKKKLWKTLTLFLLKLSQKLPFTGTIGLVSRSNFSCRNLVLPGSSLVIKNMTFFYKIVQCRAAHNAIRKLVLPTKEVITNLIAIKQVAASYFAQLIGPAMNHTQPVIDDIPRPSELLDFRFPDNTAELLVRPISEE